MSFYENIPPQVYEVTWKTGHVETVIAHQVLHDTQRLSFAMVGEGQVASHSEGARIKFHAEIDGQWMLQLSALEEDIRTIRNVTNGERTPGGAA